MFPAQLPVYNPVPLDFTHGTGCWLHTTDGRRFLDFTSGIGVNAFGHAHPYLIEALTRQAGRLWHLSNAHRIPGQRELAERYVALTFADTAFFTNSGAEAWECGVKMVRRHFWAKGQPERHRFIVFENCFHGRTMAGISAAKRPKMAEGFGPLLPGFDLIPPGDLAAVAAAIGPETACIHIEPVQGEGGVTAFSDAFLLGLRALCDQHGLLLFLDEIQCGAGRTGRFLAHEWVPGLRPDLICLAKGIGGGFPLGACIATANAAAGMTLGTHGTTYGGNPLAMAVGHAVLDLMTAEGFLDQVQARAAMLDQGLHQLIAQHPQVFVEARGRGLMRGLKVAAGLENTAVILAAREEGLLTVAAGDNVVRLLPPLIVDADEIAQALDMLSGAAVRVQSAPISSAA